MTWEDRQPRAVMKREQDEKRRKRDAKLARTEGDIKPITKAGRRLNEVWKR